MRSTDTIRRGFLVALMIPILLAGAVLAAERSRPVDGTDVTSLERMAAELGVRAAARRTPLYENLLARTTGPQAALNRDRTLALIGIDDRGRPLFVGTTNLIAAQSVGVDHLWPGGSSGYDLTGANTAGELGVWDAGAVLTSHQEFGGRVTVIDASPDVHYHATHVGGILVAAGVDPDAKGMSYAAYLDSYDWSDDESEMAAAAAGGLLISNHSYAYVCGWRWSSTESEWYWYGDVDVSGLEDAGFGSYTGANQEWDQIAYDAPYYLIVKSAGNDRNDYGPGTEEPGHYFWDPNINDWAWSTDLREYDGEATSGFDTIPYRGNCKNVLTLGAVDDVPGGWTQPIDVVMSSFSGYGPTDDGRIKPDLVANGIGLYSTYSESDTSYASFSGTSMSGPNAAGAIHLLAQMYRDTHGSQTALAATLKALAIHTADEAGANDGPDYSYGWGLLNAQAAADVIDADVTTPQRITETSLAQGERDTVLVWNPGSEPLTATVCWTDPAGTPPAWSLDPPDLMLVNDLDLRIERVSDAVEYEPWILNPVGYTIAATTGDNIRDNVEKVEVATPTTGQYRVIVSHKGTLTSGPQTYALIVSGMSVEPQAPVVSNVQFVQRSDGSGLVDVTYDLVDPDSPILTIGLDVSVDGGASWTYTVSTISGDVGAGVAPGNGKALVWDFGSDHPGQFIADALLRVTADDGS
jgi:hypothetical protein